MLAHPREFATLSERNWLSVNQFAFPESLPANVGLLDSHSLTSIGLYLTALPIFK